MSVFPQTTVTVTTYMDLNFWGATYFSECFTIHVSHLPISTGCGDNYSIYKTVMVRGRKLKQSLQTSMNLWPVAPPNLVNKQSGRLSAIHFGKKKQKQKNKRPVSNCNIPNSRWSQWTCNLQHVHNMDLELKTKNPQQILNFKELNICTTADKWLSVLAILLNVLSQLGTERFLKDELCCAQKLLLLI